MIFFLSFKMSSTTYASCNSTVTECLKDPRCLAFSPESEENSNVTYSWSWDWGSSQLISFSFTKAAYTPLQGNMWCVKSSTKEQVHATLSIYHAALACHNISQEMISAAIKYPLVYFVSALSCFRVSYTQLLLGSQAFIFPITMQLCRLMHPSDSLTEAHTTSSWDGLQKPQSCSLPVAVMHANGSLACAN